MSQTNGRFVIANQNIQIGEGVDKEMLSGAKGSVRAVVYLLRINSQSGARSLMVKLLKMEKSGNELIKEIQQHVANANGEQYVADAVVTRRKSAKIEVSVELPESGKTAKITRTGEASVIRLPRSPEDEQDRNSLKELMEERIKLCLIQVAGKKKKRRQNRRNAST
jgi:hypothetical protein